jgi:hypothetical protein
MNRRSPLPSREDTGLNGAAQMVELKIALMVMLIAILFFAIYFTAIPL